MLKRSLLTLALLIATPVALAENFAECLLDKMPGIQSAPVRFAAYKLCKEQYPGGFYSVPQGAGTGFFAKYDSGNECALAAGRDTRDHYAANLIAVSCRKLYDEPEPWGKYDKPVPATAKPASGGPVVPETQQKAAAPAVYAPMTEEMVNAVLGREPEPPARYCEFKAVMTNEDYAACGIAPPGQ